LKKLLLTSLNFLTEPGFIIFYRFDEAKRRILVKLAQHLCLPVLWQAERCGSGLAEKVNLCVEKPCEKAKFNPWELLKKHTLVKIIPFEL
jgi:hypothetical protein